MLTCPNCGSENRYGAIFCRVCGKKLDIIDQLTVENIEEKTGLKRRRRKGKSEIPPDVLRRRSIIVNSIRILLILLVATAVYLTQQTPSISAIPTSEASRKSFIQRKSDLETAVKDKKPGSVTVTQKELNSYIAGLLPDVKGGKFTKLENLQVALGEGKEKIAINMYIRLFGKKMVFQLFGTLEKSGGHIKFVPATFARVGKLPYPAFLMKLHCRNVLKDPSFKKDTDLFKELTEATVKESKIRGGSPTPSITLSVGSN
jgi:hypothetical protein